MCVKYFFKKVWCLVFENETATETHSLSDIHLEKCLYKFPLVKDTVVSAIRDMPCFCDAAS